MTVESIQDLVDDIRSDSEDEKDYIGQTAYEQQSIDIDETFEVGSIELSEEVRKTAKLAVEKRLNNDALKEYTKNRIDKVNANIKRYYSDSSEANDSKSLARVFFPETFNSCEDWSDDLYLIFDRVVDQLEIKDDGDSLEEFITKAMEINVQELERGNKELVMLIKNFPIDRIDDFLLEIQEQQDKDKQKVMLNMLEMIVRFQSNKLSSQYHFKRLDIIKSFLKHGINKSGYQVNIEEFFMHGILSGMFVAKDEWGSTGRHQLRRNESQKEGSPFNPFSYELDQEQVYRFSPKDTRLLIFPKQAINGKEIPWIVEKIPTTYHNLLNIVLDEDNKPIKNAKYDVNQVKRLGEYLKKQGAKSVKEDPIDSDLLDDAIDDVDNYSELWDIDGDITLYECHHIPFVFGGGKNKRAYKSIITGVNLNAESPYPIEDIDFLPLGVQKTPYIAGLPYNWSNFVKKDGDVAGIGLPELIEPLQRMLNNFAGHSVDILNLGLWGILGIDPDAVKDPSILKNIHPRMIIHFKNMKGRKVDEVMSWLHPPLETINQMERLFVLFQDALRRTSRKGPGGDKIQPNPTATEAASILTELQKSVNKVALRLNELLKTVLEKMYIYNMLNRQENYRIKVQGYRLKGNDVDKPFDGLTSNREMTTMIERTLDLNPEEIFIDGLEFKLNAVDTFNKRAVEKQQVMQAMNLLYDSGSVRNADGSPHIIKDDTGTPVKISEYKLLNRVMTLFELDDMFEKVEAQEASPMSSQIQPSAISPVQQPVSTPSLNASPLPSDIEKQATTLSPGVQV